MAAMKWVNRLKDKVSFAHLPPSPHAHDQSSSSPSSPVSSRPRSKYESELDFKRFWEEFRSSNSEKGKEEALEMAVEVFCRLARQNGNPSQLVNMLSDARMFSFVVARALVTDIEKLKSADGSLDGKVIMGFFTNNEKDGISPGANMLYALENLVSPPSDLQPLLDAGLLSCLVAILYVLLDPSKENIAVSVTTPEESNESYSEEQTQRIIVEGSIIHITKALAQHPGACQSLAEDDSLKLLFHVVARNLYEHTESQNNVHLSSHLLQLYRHAMQILGLLLVSDSGYTARYIHTHQLIKVLLSVIKDFDVGVGDAAYAIGIVDLILECIELSCRPGSGGVQLKHDLHNAQGYHLLVQLALKLEKSHPDVATVGTSSSEREDSSDEKSDFHPIISRLLDILVNLAQVGVHDAADAGGIGKGGKLTGLKPAWNRSYSLSLFDNDENGKVRDLDAVQVLQDIFLKANSVKLQMEVLDRLLRIFASHMENYKICQGLRTVSLFLLNTANFPEVIQEKLLKILEYAVTVVNCVPEQELLSLCCLLQQPLTPSMRHNILSFFVKLLSFDTQYKKLFREVGVLEIFIDDLKDVSASISTEFQSSGNANLPESKNGAKTMETAKMKSQNSGVLEPKKTRIFDDEVSLFVAWDCLVSLLKNGDGNQAAFRKANGVTTILPLLTIPTHRAGILRLLSCLICEDISQSHAEELGCLIEVAKNGIVSTAYGQQLKVNEETKRDVLWCIYRILNVNTASRDVYGAATGFSLLFTLLHSFQFRKEDCDACVSGTTDKSASGKSAESALCMELFNAMLHVTTMAVLGSTVNRGRLHKIVSSQTFKDLLSESGLLCDEFEEDVVNLLFCLALEQPNAATFSSRKGKGALALGQPGGKGTEQEAEASDLEQSIEMPEDANSDITSESVLNAGAVEVLISCIHCFSPTLQLRVLETVRMLAEGNAHNQECLTAVGCINLLLDYVNPISSPASAFLDHILKIIEILGSYRLSPFELRTLARYIRQSSSGECGKRLIESMERMICMEYSTPERRSLAPFVEFTMNKSGSSCMKISLGDRTWPPTAGYTFVCWFRFHNIAKGPAGDRPSDSGIKDGVSNSKDSTASKWLAKIHIFSVGSAEERSSLLDLFIDDSGVLTLATSSTSYLCFKGVHFDEGLWYHLAVVHSKPNALAGFFQSSVSYLYVNGRKRQTGKLAYSASSVGKSLQATIGTMPSEAEVRDFSWQISACYLFEEVLTAPAIFLMYTLGRGYRGLFQDTDLLRFLPYEACGGENLATLEALELELAIGTTVSKAETGLKLNSNKGDGSGIVWDMERLAAFLIQLSSRKLIFSFDGTRFDSSTTPTLSIVNLVDPLSSSASPIGGLPRLARLHGDIHICTPCSFGENIRKVGGVAVVLALVEAAESREMLHLSLTLLACVLHWSPFNARDIQACRGYHLLALFLHRRMPLFDMQDLEILFQIAACQASSFSPPVINTTGSIPVSSGLVAETSLEDTVANRDNDDHASLYGSQYDAADTFSQQDAMSRMSEFESFDSPSECSNSVVLSNPEMMEHVLLDWTLWVTAPVTIQMALLGFIERLVSMHRYRNHNLALLRRINIVQHLLVTLQRGDVEIPVLEKLVVLLGILLEDGFLQSELKYVVDFVVMTFDPPEIRGERTVIQRETMGMQVVVRNMLLEMLIDLQVTIPTDELLEVWHKTVSSKLITFLLDEAVHPSSMRWVMTLLGVCISSSVNFAAKFRTSGGYQGLAQVLPSFYDCPEVYYIHFCLVFGKSVYPRQPEVRLLDFLALMPNDDKLVELKFVDLLETIVAMSKSAFIRLAVQAQLAEQRGDQAHHATVALVASLKEDENTSEELQGDALLHKTYAARLMGGEATAPTLVTSILRFMVDLAKMCRPFSSAFRRQDLLEGCAELYFACVRSIIVIQSACDKLENEAMQNPTDFENTPNADLGFAHEQYQKKNQVSESSSTSASVQEQQKNAIDVNSVSRYKDKDSRIAEDSLRSESITSDFSVFKADNLDRLALSSDSRSSVVKRIEDAKTGPSSVFTSESTTSTDISALGTPNVNPHYAESASPFGTSARSDTNTFPGFSSVATPSTPASEFDSVMDYKLISLGSLGENFFNDLKPEVLLKVDHMGAGGGPCSGAAGAVLDLIAEVAADALMEQPKATSLIELVLEAVPLHVGSDASLIFQGLCLSRLMNSFERKLLRDDEETEKKLDKVKWSSNLEAFSWLLVDRVYMGAFPESGSVLKVLEFLLSMLQLANKDRRIEEATAAGKGLLSLSRVGIRQVEPYVQALLKNMNRMILYCFTPTFLNSCGEDEYLAPTWPETEVQKMDDGDGGFSSGAVDVYTVLQLLMANKRLVFCANNMDTELLCCLLCNSVSMLWDSRQSVRNLAAEVIKALLVFRRTALEELLIVRANQGEALDVLNNGFDKLLASNLAHFYQWLRISKDAISKVLEQSASIMWQQFMFGAAKFPGVRLKITEGRRKKEMSKRFRENSKTVRRHLDQMDERRYALDVVRESMASELRAIRQDKYGWVLHAESEWEGHVQQLLHERGIWPMANYNRGDTPEWELCDTEGPYRMRKKFVRCKMNVRLLNFGLKQFSECVGDEKLSPDIIGVGLDAADPDYNSFLHRFSVGAVSQKQVSGDTTLEDEDFKSLEGTESSSVNNIPPSDSQTSGNLMTPQFASATPSKTNSGISAHSMTEDVPGSSWSSPKQSALVNEVPKIEDSKTSHDDGEYLIRPYLEPGEKIRFRYNCERVVGLEKHDGIFLIGELCLYVIENFFIDETVRICEKGNDGHISVIDQAMGVKQSNPETGTSEGKHEGYADASSVWLGGRAWAYSGGAWGRNNVNNKRHMAHPWRMWKLENVHELLKRRYQLRHVAIELFSMDGCNDLLVFHKNERDEVFKNLVAMNLPRNSMLDTTISGASKQEVNEGGRLFKMMANSFSKRWQNGEISNFQYLMHLNTLAGRGYSDLTQYPVFPWVLSDYESEHLDLTNPKSFRRLDKPMGALTREREEEFKKRYDSWDDPEIPKFHYGSHYSSAGTVLFYLIRLPPFSEENKQLQGGQFDHADRLFNSIKDTWSSASQGNTADVKELIPEFFYMPEFLENRFNLNLGVKQSGEKVEGVMLPLWAKGSAREFIRLHREALESQYVSENLHHWIDLIFGFKQRGKAAVDATNVFFYLTYEGAVEIDSIQDPSMKSSILAQINHFGQTPRQLFSKPHPKRRCQQKAPVIHALRYNNLLVPQEIRTIGSAISQITIFHDKLIIAGSNQILKPRSYSKYISWGYPDRSLRFISYDQDKLLSTHEGLHGGGQVQCAGMSRDGKNLVTGGDDGVVALWRQRKDGARKQRRLHLLRALCAHTRKITCVAVCQPYGLVVSGSEDCTVIFWDLSSLEFVRQLPELPASVSSLHVNELTGDVVTAAGTTLTVWSINGDCLATVNTSQLPSDTIVSITSASFSDWMEANWFITGHQSGYLKLWRIEYRSNDVGTRSRGRSQSFSSDMEFLKPLDEVPTIPKDARKRAISSAKFMQCLVPEYHLTLLRVLKWHKQPVTSVYLTSDLKQIFSGDAAGHLVQWTLPEGSLKNSSLQESQRETCDGCQQEITEMIGKQHCKNCGQQICLNCFGDGSGADSKEYVEPLTVCKNCCPSRTMSAFERRESSVFKRDQDRSLSFNSSRFDRSNSRSF